VYNPFLVKFPRLNLLKVWPGSYSNTEQILNNYTNPDGKKRKFHEKNKQYQRASRLWKRQKDIDQGPRNPDSGKLISLPSAMLPTPATTSQGISNLPT
jgi:hypothetical protein